MTRTAKQMSKRISVAVFAIGTLTANRASADFAFCNFDGPLHTEGGFNLRAINNHGTALGTSFDESFNVRGFTRSADGTLLDFSLPNGSAGEGFQTQLGAINDDNVVAAYLPTVPRAHGNPLLLLRNGAIDATIPLPAEFGTTIVRGLSNAGVMAGTVNDLEARKPRGFVRNAAGNFTKFEANPTTIFTEVEGINNAGIVIGNFSILNSFTQGFERSVDGTITLLPNPATIGGKTVFAIFYSSINDAGVTVGSFQDPSERFYGFVRDPQGHFTLVQNPANPLSTGLTGINNRGTVSGTYIDGSGLVHGFIAEPCPADSNRDGVVGLADLSILLTHFGASDGATVEDGDTNLDGDVNLADLSNLLANFGQTCSQ
jgi:hypothetical protein